LLIKNKLIDVKERAVYVFGLESLLLNSSELIIIFIISLLFTDIRFFVTFILVFLPLRLTGGGFHFSKSSVCFISSITMFVIAVLANNIYPKLYENNIYVIFTIILAVVLLLIAPVENKSNPLSDHKKKKNKVLFSSFLTVDVILLIIFKNLHLQPATGIIIFVSCTSLLLFFGKLKAFEDSLIEKNNKSNS